MRIRVPDYYKDFKCIASECTDTCCAGWEVDVDVAAQEYYKTVEGDFGKRLKDNTIIDEDGIRFKLVENRRCCFLNDCNLCDLYTALGEEHLCDTCTDFPRFSEVFGDLKEKGISLSCPTAAKLIMDHDEPLTWEESEEDEMIGLNDIDFDLYMQLTAARSQAIGIIQNRDRDIIWRIIAVLNFANDIQKYIFKGKYKKIVKVRDKYSGEKYLEKVVAKMTKKAAKHVDGAANISNLIDIFSSFEVVNECWPDKLRMAKAANDLCRNDDSEYKAYFKGREVQYEQLMVYFVYRYFMKAVYDLDLIAKVKLSVASVIVIRAVEKAAWHENRELTLGEFIDLAHLYSKEIEHSDENMDSIEDLCYNSICFHIEALIASLT